MAMRKTFEDEQLVWTPADNNSLKSRDKGSVMFPAKGGFVSMIAEVKDPEDENASMINLDILEEVKKFSDDMQTSKVKINETEVNWTDVCNKIMGKCLVMESILQWGYDNQNQWKPKDLYASDAELLSAV